MARKQRALAYIPFTLLQGGADAFVQATIATALFGQTKTCYRLASLELELPAHPVAAGADLQFSLTRKSYAAMPTSPIVEKSMIYYHRRMCTFTTSGLMQWERTLVKMWNDDDAPVIVEDPIYAQFDTATTTATSTLYGRLGYWLDSISEVDRLQLIANSLS